MANKQLVCALLWVLALIGSIIEHGEAASDFVKADGTSFAVNGESFYPNGFNAYWLMSKGSKPSEMDKVSRALCQASSYGMTVVRTWAFKDGGYRPLQSSPGVYNEDMFKTILLRNNTKTGVVYKDDPSIMAWELMNEGRCKSDLSGRTMQAWIEEMAGYVKAIDRNHLLEVGLEGFFGGLDQDQEAIQYDPFASSRNVGSDFISNNQIHGIDFATIHLYPNLWIPHADDATQLSFLRDWIHSHSNAADEILRKPLLVTEFGKTSRFAGCNGVDKVAFYRTAYAVIYKLIRARSACAGGLFWQLLLPGMENLSDGYEIILSDCPSIANIIFRHSRLISSLNGPSLRGLTSTYQ
ncbi:putative mannan endo-1,4-beta-mannosidase 9 isoform X1 [Dioscorea cayenensis subsp. rotundata]|uniref:mannan endo-1,4-beta-mannosidase n=1 Tax=Dioscorea cayennensis subsp. rotundata TaxID=55577 RepID=A0AB40AH46_DIOCR|nr:putative mannan endo-1,4-beta-mannosidase 9 isoform X1 [Dioscorea cayenensis subsp. rotundata]